MKRIINAALTIALFPFCGFAVDGQVLINMSTVNATGGFPFKITQPGSYKLSGNLFLPDANSTGIQILSNAVTLDLNGFAIIGPGTFGVGDGVQIGTALQAYYHITIRNGTIQGTGSAGVDILAGDSVIVEEMNIGGNLQYGISGSNHVIFPQNIIVRHNTITGNGFSPLGGGGGVGLAAGCIVADNTVSVNSTFGISVVVGNVARNLIMNNGAANLEMIGGGYQGNVIVGGGVLPGVNLGGNACNGSLCP